VKKRTRIAALIAGLIVLLIVGLIAALPAIVTLNRVKKDITETLTQAAGRPVTIHKLSLSLYPWLGIRLQGATLGNAPGFGQRPLARVADAVVEVRVIPLLHKRIVLRRVILTGLHFNLRTNKAGVTNWATLTHHAPRKSKAISTVQTSSNTPAFALLSAAGLSLKNATIDYRNAQTRAHDVLTHLSLRSGEIRPQRPVSVRLSGALETGGRPAFPFRLSADISYQGDTYTLNPVRFSVATLRGLGSFKLALAPGAWDAQGQIHIPRFAPRPLLRAFAISYTPTDKTVLRSAQADLGFHLTAGHLLISPLRLTLDHTVMTGRLSRAAHPQLYRATLAIDTLDLSSYLPLSKPAAGALKGGPRTPRAPAPPAQPLPPLIATLDVSRLALHGLDATHVHAHVVAGKGIVTLQPLSMDLYQGSLQGMAMAHLASPVPRWRMHARLQDVHVGALLHALQLFHGVSGRLDAKADLAGTGTTPVLMEKNLSGTLSGAMQKGALRGLDLDLIAKNPKLAAGSHRVKRLAGTAFSHLRFAATIAQGVLHMNRLSMHTSRATIGGHGTVVLTTKTLDYLLKVALASGLVIPVRVQGPIGHVRFRVSLNRLLKDSSHNGMGPALKSLKGRLRHFLGLH